MKMKIVAKQPSPMNYDFIDALDAIEERDYTKALNIFSESRAISKKMPDSDIAKLYYYAVSKRTSRDLDKVKGLLDTIETQGWEKQTVEYIKYKNTGKNKVDLPERGKPIAALCNLWMG